MDIDLNDYSGGPNWLSPAGRQDVAPIRAKYRAAYLSTLQSVLTPASEATLARLEKAIADYNARGQATADKRAGRDPEARNIIAVFTHAFYMLDRTEPMVRDMIEGGLMDVAGLPGKVRGTVAAGKKVADQIAVVRTKAMKQAFSYLRSTLPNDDDGPLHIYGRTLSAWAQGISEQEAARIKSAISVGLTAGESNTDIAHRVIGSRRANGTEGATEITRQHILRLGKGLLHKRKTRMSGDSTDVRRV
jgi:hypothetical protein